MHAPAPSLTEITQLTRAELTTASTPDAIRECGRAALALLPCQPAACRKLAYAKLHDVPYKEVKTCWRRLYVDASLWEVVRVVEGRVGGGVKEKEGEEQGIREEKGMEEWVGEVVRLLDMALILTGAPAREEVIELWFMALREVLPDVYTPSSTTEAEKDTDTAPRPSKRQKRTPTLSFATSLSTLPPLTHPIPHATNPSLSSFAAKLSNTATHTPLVLHDTITHWPALHERPWSDPSYLLSATLNGLRLVPVEIGRSYVSEGWTQRILSVREFVEGYMMEGYAGAEKEKGKEPGYLAQHDLLSQIPSLRADIAVPDYCYLDPAPSLPPPSTSTSQPQPQPRLASPLLNAWFGPRGTVSPLHTDPYHNILAQVVGYKYIRLYAPDQTPVLYPRGTDENGVDMRNTSSVDLDRAVRVCGGRGTLGWLGAGEGTGGEGEGEGKAEGDGDGDEGEGETREEFEKQFPGFAQAAYVECVLGPGECLYLPPGWWHYVRSLSASFSVSFWWD